jgi:hypothetical protein
MQWILKLKHDVNIADLISCFLLFLRQDVKTCTNIMHLKINCSLLVLVLGIFYVFMQQHSS